MNRSFYGLILAALAAGSYTLPAGGAQSSEPSATKTAHRTSTTSNSSSATASTKKTNHSGSKRSLSKTRTKKVKGQTAPTPDRINEIQEALAKRGSLSDAPSGKWDDSTVEGMKKFQASQGLQPTGKLDALTLQKLGLGSEIAGVAAPTPPPNSINRLRNTSSLPPESQEQ